MESNRSLSRVLWPLCECRGGQRRGESEDAVTGQELSRVVGFCIDYFFLSLLSVLGLHCCARSFSSHERGLFLVAVPELLIEKLLLRSTGSRYTGFSSCHVQALESAGFSSCDTWA